MKNIVDVLQSALSFDSLRAAFLEVLYSIIPFQAAENCCMCCCCDDRCC